MKSYEYKQLGLENLSLVERNVPVVKAGQVLIKVHAVSLNYRDLLFAWGLYNPKPNLPSVPVSDGAGEVVAIGEGVNRWKVGDRVAQIFMQGWLGGPIAPHYAKTALGGGDVDGVLREYVVFPEDGLVAIPEHLSYEEAACLPCAGVTAWNALVNVGRVKSGDVILTLGTGGVSLFALQIAKLHGAKVISTSSSDEKLARARALGADEIINYKTTPDWEKEVSRLTNRRGVDHVVEVGGAGTLPRSIKAARVGGLISVIGVLAQGNGVDPMSILMKSLHVQGIFVGSREMFEDLNRAVSLNGLKPMIDRVFGFDEVPAALAHMQSGAHFGKIVVKVP